MPYYTGQAAAALNGDGCDIDADGLNQRFGMLMAMMTSEGTATVAVGGRFQLRRSLGGAAAGVPEKLNTNSPAAGGKAGLDNIVTTGGNGSQFVLLPFPVLTTIRGAQRLWRLTNPRKPLYVIINGFINSYISATGTLGGSSAVNAVYGQDDLLPPPPRSRIANRNVRRGFYPMSGLMCGKMGVSTEPTVTGYSQDYTMVQPFDFLSAVQVPMCGALLASLLPASADLAFRRWPQPAMRY